LARLGRTLLYGQIIVLTFVVRPREEKGSATPTGRLVVEVIYLGHRIVTTTSLPPLRALDIIVRVQHAVAELAAHRVRQLG
jgi:hypothetical protein